VYTIVFFVFLLVCVALIGLVLIQHGKGAEVGAAFGSGASQTMFGSRGSASFLTRATAVLATLFFVLSLLLAYLSTQSIQRESVLQTGESQQAPAGNVSDVPVDVPATNEGGAGQ